MKDTSRIPNQDLVRILFGAAVEAVQADVLFNRHASAHELRQLAEKSERIGVIGAGKAGIPMAFCAEQALGDAAATGLVVVPRGYVRTLPARFRMPSRIEIVESGHPVPSAEGAEAGGRMLELVQQYDVRDLVVVLISGGASALLPTALAGISTDDMSETTNALLRSGATIHEINTVRKHITAIGGGRLAQAAYPARVVNYVISDVIGNDISFIGSGPCAPDETTRGDARDIVTRHDLWPQLPAKVSNYLRAQAPEANSDTPNAVAVVFESVTSTLLGTNTDALEGARDEAVRKGLSATIVQSDFRGEARDAGAVVARAIANATEGTCLIWGGETTVTVRGPGKGGRNQELVLAGALELHRLKSDAIILSAGTDGIDGMTSAAGAWADGGTIRRARTMRLDAEAVLQQNDSGSFFEALGQQVVTGPTHTNVMDLVIALKR